jgi:hypothetical protein
MARRPRAAAEKHTWIFFRADRLLPGCLPLPVVGRLGQPALGLAPKK